jgi:CheY-like chemotaxis protein
VFQEFYQAGPLLGGLTKGLGLGLAIVKRLSDLLNHRIELESTLGRGTIVRIQVPRAESQILELAPPTASMPNLHGTRVLVVDDDPAARDAIQGLLAQWGCDAVVVNGGEEAVAQARTRRPDVVLCDLRLADGVNGVLVVDRLKREHGAGLPCAFITGESALERIAEARNTGDPIAFKPTRPAKLRALIEHLLHAQ